MPAEVLTEDELLALCWDDPGIVLADPSGDGVVVAAVTETTFGPVGSVKLVLVEERARRQGLGRRLLAAAEEWCAGSGARAVQLGASVPAYLWPGVDVAMVPMLCLAEAAGYSPTGAELNMALPTTFRHEPPDGVRVDRVLDDDAAAATLAWAEQAWPHWVPELRRAIEQGGCFAAWGNDDAVVGFACHSVNRAGWVGPMATDPTGRGTGVGSALLGSVCTDLMVAGFTEAEIAWVGPVRFYAKAGARVSRTFRTFHRVL